MALQGVPFSPNSLLLGVLNALKNGHLGAGWSGRVRPACLPLPFICLPVLFICLPSSVLVVGFAAGLSPTSFHLSPTSFHLSPSSFPTSCHMSPTSFHLSPRLGACGPVPGWLVSHFLSFVSHFFSFVRLGLVVGFAAGLSPTCFHLSPTSFICLPVLFIFGLPGWVLVVGFPAGLSRTSFHSPNSLLLGVLNALKNGHLGAGWSGRVRPACLPLPFICLPVLFICLPSSVLVVGFAAGLSPTSFHLSPTSFHLSPSSFPTSCHMSPTSFHLSPRLGACGPVPGWLVSHFLSFVSHFFSFVRLGRVCGWLVSHVLSFVSHFFHLSPSSFHFWSPRLGACGRVPGWLVSHFLSFVSYFFSLVSFPFICLPGSVLVVGFPAGLSPTSFPTSFHSPNSLLLGVLNALKNGHLGAGWSGRVRPACLPLPFICLPVLFICLPTSLLLFGFAAGLSPTSFHLSPTSFHLSPSSFPTSCHMSPTSFHLSPRLGACGPVPGWLVSHFLSFVSRFFSFVRLGLVVGFAAGLSPTCFHLSPTSFICLPVLFIFGLPGWVLVVGNGHLGAGWSGRVRPACLPLPFIPQTVYC